MKASGWIIGVRRRAEYYVTVTSTRLPLAWDVVMGWRAVIIIGGQPDSSDRCWHYTPFELLQWKMGDVQILYLVSTLRWQWLEKARFGRILWKELNCGLNNNWRLYYFNLLFGDNKLSEQKHWFVITRISFSTTTSVIRIIISIRVSQKNTFFVYNFGGLIPGS